MGASFHDICAPILLLVCINGVLGTQSNGYEPMVAFVCNKDAMYTDPDLGWRSYSSVDCLENKENILKFCQLVYPDRDVRNVVDTAEELEISGWCPLGESHCESSNTFTVQAYRCLTGAFQSDALIVPTDCKFDYTHLPDTCTGFTYWHDLATSTCLNQSLSLHSYSALVPCGTDLWTGVEYVCCPSELGEGDDDLVSKYLHLQLIAGQYNDEHEAFELAKASQAEINKEKTVKMVEEWYKARDRVVALQAVDPDKAEALNTEITERYSREYTAMQKEGETAIRQLDELHQRHVQVNLNYKKRVCMQKLMEELQSSNYKSDDISLLLHNYILVEQKDAIHSVKHFVKVRARNAMDAWDLQPSIIEHLTLISKRINQSIDLMDTLADEDVAESLKVSTRRWVKESLFDIDGTRELLIALPQPQEPDTSAHGRVTTAMPPYKVTNSVLHLSSVNMVDSGSHPGKDLMDRDNGEASDSPSQAADNSGYVDYISDDGKSRNLSDKAILSIMAGLATALMVIIFAMLFVKKSSRSSKRFRHTYLQVSADTPDLSPEDRHIVAMQNGYENPIYALLEQKK